jgi:hypothetical protein
VYEGPTLAAVGGGLAGFCAHVKWTPKTGPPAKIAVDRSRRKWPE